jgi:hypothetical protein
MPIEVQGLDRLVQKFNEFKFSGKKAASRFLRMVGEESVILLEMNSPKRTGEFSKSWSIISQGADYIDVGTSDPELYGYITQGTSPHIIRPRNKSVLRFEIGGQEIFTTLVQHPGTKPNTLLLEVGNQINKIILERLEQSLAENHEFFRDLPGGKGRRFQQVGRTSAGFKGGVSFAGRATLIRPGTGRKQLKRRLSLRRRRGKTVNPSRKDVYLG